MSQPEIFDICKNGDAAKAAAVLKRDSKQLNAVSRVLFSFI